MEIGKGQTTETSFFPVNILHVHLTKRELRKYHRHSEI